MNSLDKQNTIFNTANLVSLSRKILLCANRGLDRKEFRSEVQHILIKACQCDSLELRIIEYGKMWQSEYTSDGKYTYSILKNECRIDKSGKIIPCMANGSDLESICQDIYCGNYNPTLPYYSKNGSFFMRDTDTPLELSSQTCQWAGGRSINIRGDYKSIIIIPLKIENESSGLIISKSRQKDFFKKENVNLYEEVAQILGIAFEHRQAQVSLRERIKELTCLFGIAKVAAQPNIQIESILKDIVRLLPLGWLYPDVAESSITLDGKAYSTTGFLENQPKISSQIYANNEFRGKVEVAYNTDMPELDEGPFLKEERNLLDAIAREISIIIERRQVEQEKENLQEQLRHADRLATIGQLAAGVAHELNEPLGSVLGFAQLIKKDIENSNQIIEDVNKIEAASLHAREVIKKLMLFSRQSPQKKSQIDINKMVEDGLYFLESRCAKAGIDLVKEFGKDLPDLMGDKSQLYQVLVNLVVNSIQAMPDGGTINISTSLDGNNVLLSVKDTGQGIEEDIIDKIFVPFFTTKDIDEGTGLGLAVVHGIVSSHGGIIKVESKIGGGTKFKIRLPINREDKK